MSENFKLFVAWILYAVFAMSYAVWVVAAVKIWNAMRRRRPSAPEVSRWLDQPPLSSKAFGYGLVLAWLAAMGSGWLLMRL
jgi:hypothetical protein